MKKLLKAIWHFLSGIWKNLPDTAKKAVHIGAIVVDGIKSFDDNNPEILDIITHIIPGNIDDLIKDRLRSFLPKIVIEMKLVDAAAGLTDPHEIVKAAAKALQQIEGDWLSEGARKNFYDSLAVLIAQVAADGELTWDDAKYVLKWYYDHEEEYKLSQAA